MALDLSPSELHSTDAIRIVGLGASAGGLEALELFFANVPADSHLAYVVVQHMDPTHKAMLAPLLQRVTSLPVHEAADTVHIEPNTIYVIAPDSELTVSKGYLHVAHNQNSRGPRFTIDHLFNSLAQNLGDQAIGVVLSGMGSDGTVGLQSIKTNGGLTLAQQPESAQFSSMPQNAIATGQVDIVDAPAKLPMLLTQAIERTTVIGQDNHSEPDTPIEALSTIVSILHEHTRHDLSQYKSSTLLRRIERRVMLHNIESMPAYIDLLKANPQERDLLFAEMLIGVTQFFRDSIVWAELTQRVLPDLLLNRQRTPEVRAWVIGCSTGEEAYSLAMAFDEVRSNIPTLSNHTLQIFATDLNADAIAVARKGWYPAKTMDGLSTEQIARFFVAHHGGFQIKKQIRDMVLFAQHDVTLDPPFTKLDLLSCRNVLIYFKHALQDRLLPLFHFCMNPGGVLLLGGSETIGRYQSLFRPLTLKLRLYQRSDQPWSIRSVDFPVNRHAPNYKKAQETHVSSSFNPPGNLQAVADQLLLQNYAPSAVLVNSSGDILYISGRTGRYLEPAAGKVNWNIHAMVRPSIRTQLAVALRNALQNLTTIEIKGVRVPDAEPYTVDISVQALREPKAFEGMAMVVFREVPGVPISKRKRLHNQAEQEAAISQELERAQEEIRALRQEMSASQEALQAANESLQSTNEELQSANEELTSSKEETQSMNEELQTINGELQIKLDDLALAQSDMQNLLNSTDIATLFLDNDLHVRRFTESVSSIFHLREGDVGRPLTDLASKLDYPQLLSDAQETLKTLASNTQQIATTDGRWFSVRIMPYRTLTNMIQGVVLTFVDITKAKELEFRLREGCNET